MRSGVGARVPVGLVRERVAEGACRGGKEGWRLTSPMAAKTGGVLKKTSHSAQACRPLNSHAARSGWWMPANQPRITP